MVCYRAYCPLPEFCCASVNCKGMLVYLDRHDPNIHLVKNKIWEKNSIWRRKVLDQMSLIDFYTSNGSAMLISPAPHRCDRQFHSWFFSTAVNLAQIQQQLTMEDTSRLCFSVDYFLFFSFSHRASTTTINYVD